MSDSIKEKVEGYLKTLDLHLAAAEMAIKANKGEAAEADIFQARDALRHVQSFAAKISN